MAPVRLPFLAVALVLAGLLAGGFYAHQAPVEGPVSVIELRAPRTGDGEGDRRPNGRVRQDGSGKNEPRDGGGSGGGSGAVPVPAPVSKPAGAVDDDDDADGDDDRASDGGDS